VFIDNWSGIVAWENADRVAGSPANTSTGMTTLVNPQATVQACSTPSLIPIKPYFDECRWKTQHLLVEPQRDPAERCERARVLGDKSCGFNGLFSNYGTFPDRSPYQGEVVEEAITFEQNNVWRDNTYTVTGASWSTRAGMLSPGTPGGQRRMVRALAAT
jgi:hypothetical protein